MAAEQHASIGSCQQQDFASPRRPSTACSAASFSSQFSHMHQQAHGAAVYNPNLALTTDPGPNPNPNPNLP